MVVVVNIHASVAVPIIQLPHADPTMKVVGVSTQAMAVARIDSLQQLVRTSKDVLVILISLVVVPMALPLREDRMVEAVAARQQNLSAVQIIEHLRRDRTLPVALVTPRSTAVVLMALKMHRVRISRAVIVYQVFLVLLARSHGIVVPVGTLRLIGSLILSMVVARGSGMVAVMEMKIGSRVRKSARIHALRPRDAVSFINV